MERLPCSTATSLSRPIPVSTCCWGRGCRLPSASLAREGMQGEAAPRITGMRQLLKWSRGMWRGPRGLTGQAPEGSMLPHTPYRIHTMMASGPVLSHKGASPSHSHLGPCLDPAIPLLGCNSLPWKETCQGWKKILRVQLYHVRRQQRPESSSD